MGECSFLSTARNRVQCFEECDLYNLAENEGVCPFKELREKELNKKNLCKFDREEKEMA